MTQLRTPSPTFPCNTLLLLAVVLLTTTSSACDRHSAHAQPSYITSIKQQAGDDNGATLTVGIIAGITVGGIVLVVAIVFLIVFMSRRCTKPEENEYQEFADWRKDRKWTSIDIAREGGKPVPESTVQQPPPIGSLRFTRDPGPAHV